MARTPLPLDRIAGSRGAPFRARSAARLGLCHRIRGGHARSICAEPRVPAGRYTLTFARASGAIEVTVDYVVLAIPFAVLRGIDTSRAGFDALKNEAIQELGRAQNAKTQLQFKRRIWNRRGAWPGLSNGSSYADTGYQ